MRRAASETELTVRAANKPGAEDQVLSILADREVSVLALCSCSAGDKPVLFLVTDEPRSAKQALMSTGFDCRINSIVAARVQNRIGAMAELGNRLKAAGVEVVYSYASYNENEEIFAVFKINDDVHALQVLEEGNTGNLSHRGCS
jgi:hypothetical protein